MADDVGAKKTCFVVSPIGAVGSPARTHADWLYEGIIEPTFEESFKDFRLIRADKISEPGMIDSQIINFLLDSELVIADMSLLNANVFYEMGIRHTAQKPIVHVFLEGSEIPFDVKPYRAIPFSIAQHKHLLSARSDLKAAVAEAVKPDHPINNPVTRARGIAHFAESASEPEIVLAEQVRSLEARLAEVENSSQLGTFNHAPRNRRNYIANRSVKGAVVKFTSNTFDDEMEEMRAADSIVKAIKKATQQEFIANYAPGQVQLLFDDEINSLTRALINNVAFGIKGVDEVMWTGPR